MSHQPECAPPLGLAPDGSLRPPRVAGAGLGTEAGAVATAAVGEEQVMPREAPACSGVSRRRGRRGRALTFAWRRSRCAAIRPRGLERGRNVVFSAETRDTVVPAPVPRRPSRGRLPVVVRAVAGDGAQHARSPLLPLVAGEASDESAGGGPGREVPRPCSACGGRHEDHLGPRRDAPTRRRAPRASAVSLASWRLPHRLPGERAVNPSTIAPCFGPPPASRGDYERAPAPEEWR